MRLPAQIPEDKLSTNKTLVRVEVTTMEEKEAVSR